MHGHTWLHCIDLTSCCYDKHYTIGSNSCNTVHKCHTQTHKNTNVVILYYKTCTVHFLLCLNMNQPLSSMSVTLFFDRLYIQYLFSSLCCFKFSLFSKHKITCTSKTLIFIAIQLYLSIKYGCHNCIIYPYSSSGSDVFIHVINLFVLLSLCQEL